VVAVTLGRLGCIVATQDRIWRIYPPDIRAVNTVGCGDVFLAGALKSIACGKSLKESFIFATALSASKAEKLKTSEYDLKKAEEFARSIKVEDEFKERDRRLSI